MRARPQSDGLERLGQAVKLAIDREVVGREARTNNNNNEPRLGLSASVGAL